MLSVSEFTRNENIYIKLLILKNPNQSDNIFKHDILCVWMILFGSAKSFFCQEWSKTMQRVLQAKWDIWRYNTKQQPEATYTLSKYDKELLKKFNMLIRHRRRGHLQEEANRQNLQRARITAQNHISGRMWEDSTRAKLLRVELNLHSARRKRLSFWWLKPMPNQKME